MAERAARSRDQEAAADDGPLQLSLSDQQDPAEITHPITPASASFACRYPRLAAEWARTGAPPRQLVTAR